MSPATVTPADDGCHARVQGAARLKYRKLRFAPFGFGFVVPFLCEELQNPQPRKEQTMNPANNSEQPKAAPAYENRVTLIGYLGREPQLLEGRAVLSLATKRSWKPKDSDDWQSRTDWHRIVVWPPLAEAVRALAKGDHVFIEGELLTSQYERVLHVNSDDVVTVKTKAWEIRACAIRKLDAKAKATQPEAVAA
jgi:single-strand DNA-binding protein